ncbi:geranylgeranyl diphosphate synthase type II [Mucilaginibacter gracilis]|uniref:Geranylgeranyl diphosphate synthase type II n=1 Tax=Mucilaginibacter gracilis TaxID=423350 RepID=A0A495J5Z7_9SPHI|nr:polyprenyl synthetase family protein [Mucilaginibacter gracilis]RKR83419.1 geranylgeranyl diphosphate synthase type II [Mucilaginibacter gracilis]
MQQIQQLQNSINQYIANKRYGASPAELYDPIGYIMSLGGKRLRPCLLLMACDMFGGDVEQALAPALAIEVFHNFTLMHDDIMDKAPLRRGKPTVHEKWNANVAILSGDVMMVESNKLIMQVNDSILRPVLDVFNNTAVGVCEGQQIDMNFETRAIVGIDEYINMIRLKTAVLVGGALKMGALIGGATDSEGTLLYNFGEQLGIAFQLQDDILDVYGDPEKFGKQVGGDIISNKKTYLLIKALELAQGETLTQLNQWLAADDFDPAKKVEAVKSIYNQLGIRERAEAEMSQYAEKALQNFEKINLPDNRKTVLKEFADALLVREY